MKVTSPIPRHCEKSQLMHRHTNAVEVVKLINNHLQKSGILNYYLTTLIAGLPEQIFKLPAIEEVDASDNKIFAWPKKLDKLEKKASVNTNGKIFYQ